MNEDGLEHVPFDSLRMDTSILSPEEQKSLEDKVTSMQKIIDKRWGSFIPKETQDRSTEFSKHMILVDQESFRELYDGWEEEPLLSVQGDLNRELVLSELGSRYYSQEVLKDLAIEEAHTKLDVKAHEEYVMLINKHGNDVHKLFFGSPVQTRATNHILSEFTPEMVGQILPGYYEEAVGNGTEMTAESARGFTYTPDSLVVVKRKDATGEVLSEKKMRKGEGIENHDLAHELIHLYEPPQR